MKHDQYKDWLILSMYGELNEDALALLQQHMEHCASCREEKKQLSAWKTLVDAHRPPIVTDELLAQARRERRVASAVRSERWSGIEAWIGILFGTPLRSVGISVALVLVGFALGMMISGNALDGSFPLDHFLIGQQTGAESTAPRIQGLRFLRRDAASGEVEIEFQAVAPMTVKGNVKDDHIQRLLAEALVGETNPGVRLRTVSMFRDPAANSDNVNESVKQALISALRYDSNLGVRKAALAVLKNYMPDPDVIKSIVWVMEKEKNTGMRVAAIDALNLSMYPDQRPPQEVVQALRTAAASEENSYIRIRAQETLKEAQQ